MSGWYGLISIFEQQRDDIADWRGSPPEACPHDGQPLSTGPDGQLFCVSDGWTWDGTPEGKRGTA